MIIISKDRVIALIVVMKTLLEVLEGGEFEEVQWIVFKGFFEDAGFEPALLEQVPLIAVLQIACTKFSKLNLEEYWVDGDELITEN